MTRPSRTASGEAEPLGVAEAAALFAPLRGTKVVLAVSGGPDSTALMHLFATARDMAGLLPAAVGSVDHGLHAGSRAVAEAVAAAAGALGFAAAVLCWEGRKPSAGLQAAAREARYALLEDLARRVGATHVVTAHTLDDQAETVLFRLARGSGPAGLAAMRPVAQQGGVAVSRPLLGIARARLRAACDAGGWPYVSDPANADPRFARTRIRRLLPSLAAEGLDAATLATLAERLARDEEALRAFAQARHDELWRGGDGGARRYDAAALLGAPVAIQLRVLALALTDFAKPGAPRLGRLEACVDALGLAREAGTPLRRTLHGAVLRLGGDGRLDITREGPRRRGRGATSAG